METDPFGLITKRHLIDICVKLSITKTKYKSKSKIQLIDLILQSLLINNTSTQIKMDNNIMMLKLPAHSDVSFTPSPLHSEIYIPPKPPTCSIPISQSILVTQPKPLIRAKLSSYHISSTPVTSSTPK